MKKQLYILITALLIIIQFSGCKKFLEEQSQDEMRPATIEDITGLMAGEGYPYITNINPFLDLMTDDVQCYGGQNEKNYITVVKKGKAPFSWAKDMYQELLLPSGWAANATYINTWEIIYNKISGCNTVLAYIDKVSGSDVDKNNLRGQALAMRAFYYFYLVNMYGMPYNAPGINLETSPGIPLRLRMEVTDSFYTRNSIAEVYRQIETDLKAGLQYMKNYSKTTDIFKMNPAAAYALLSRMYLYQEKWEQSIAYADSVIAIRPNLTQLSTYKGESPAGYYRYNNGTTLTYANRIYDPALSTEIIWCYRAIGGPNMGTSQDEIYKNTMSPVYTAALNPPYGASSGLLSLYDSRPQTDTAIYLGDLRSRIFILTVPYTQNFSVILGYKFTGGNGNGGDGIRTAELYLNRAEAKIQLAIKNGNTALIQQALNDINELRKSRYDRRKQYENIVITDPQQLLNFCRDERRREFPFEGGHRWFDLRRYGMPAITHYYEDEPGSGETFTLEKGDSRYTLQIPKVVLERNGNLAQNP